MWRKSYEKNILRESGETSAEDDKAGICDYLDISKDGQQFIEAN